MSTKEDVRHMLEIIGRSSGYFEYQTVVEKRVDTLQNVFNRITIV